MEENKAEFIGTNPVLPVQDVKETTRFYHERLGFEIDVLWENPNYGCVRRGDVVIEFGEGRPGHVGSGVCIIHVSDVNKLYRELQAAGIELVGDLADRNYGSRDFRVRDNDGNLLIFTSSLPNKDQLIAKRNVASQIN